MSASLYFLMLLLAIIIPSKSFFFGHSLSHFRNSLDSTKKRATVEVDLGDRSYPIYINRDILKSSTLLKQHLKTKKALIVSNTKVGPLYSSQIKATLQQLGIETHEVILPDGEEFKDMDTLMKILDAALEFKLDRKSVMLALGGGVIGDMCGFAAAIYQRGIQFIQIPTSLMAMVDSSVGGKTAVNHPLGKNMIGAFYQPIAVLADISTLQTLPDREYRSGLSEVVKYGLIRDPELFEWLEKNVEAILQREDSAVQHMIQKSCEIKANIVENDEKESGVRALLNLGHTFGHAIEASSGYGTWLHGEAVAAGTVMAATMSNQVGWIDEQLLQRIITLFQKFQLPIDLENPQIEEESKSLNQFTAQGFLDLMSVDKKVADGRLNLILLKNTLGTAIITDEYNQTILSEIVHKFIDKYNKNNSC
jgi:3-dehydroquinate synthase